MSKPIAMSLVRPAAIALALSTPLAVPLTLSGTGALTLTLSGQGVIDVGPSTPARMSLEFQKFLAGASGGSLERSLLVDASRPIAYVAYANRIVRLDYATWPPVETTASTTDVHTDWPNRATLGYA